MARKKKTNWPQVYDDPAWQARYEHLREAGNNDRFAQMLTEQRPPGTKGTESAFSQGRTNGQDFDNWPSFIRDKLIADAKRRGISLQGKMYCSGLAEYGCDSRALVSDGSELLSRAKAANKHVRGAVNHEAIDLPTPPPSKLLADDLVRDAMRVMVKENPDLKHKPKAKLREMVLEKHARKRPSVAKVG